MEQFIKPELLADNCHSHHKEDVSRHFTEEEMVDLKKELAERHVQLTQRKQVMKTIAELLAENFPEPREALLDYIETSKIEGDLGTKELNTEIARLTTAINNKVIEKNEEVFVFVYPEENKAGVYSQTGHFIVHQATQARGKSRYYFFTS